MNENYYIYHPHETQKENKRVKYHIFSDKDVELKTLCGIDTTKYLLGFSSKKDAITPEWYNQNIKNDTGRVCKKCAKKLFALLKKID